MLAVFAMVMAGCTRNNGDIGDWFGIWHMTSVDADGKPVESYEGNIFWKFQNNIINLVKVETGEGEHGRDDCWGTWEESGNRLLLNFTYSDDENSVESGENGATIYAPFPILHIPYGTISQLEIVNRSGGNITLKYVSPEQVTYTYTLKKQ